MRNRQEKLLKHLKNFIILCDKNEIFYIASGSILLGAINKKGLLEGEQKIEVAMTIESYNKLKKIAIENIIDGSIDSKYPEINPKFLPEGETFDSTNIFIDILIIVPTTLKKVKKWGGFMHKRHFFYKRVHSTYTPYNGYEKLMKALTMPVRNQYKQLTYKTAFNKLHDAKNEGFFTVHKPSCKPYKHWIPHLTFNTKRVQFEDFGIRIPLEWKTILEVKYGKDYRKIAQKKVSFEFIDSVSTRKLSKNSQQEQKENKAN